MSAGKLLWSDNEPDGIKTKILSHDEWIAMVKGHICLELKNHPPPPQYKEDIL
jgi:hypothetical protein